MRNTSDMIEKYLKELLSQAAEIEIRRSEIAEHFGVVPSQINYVIKTRFTLPKGFEVESKRGGGGYIRIVRIQYSDAHDFLMDILNKMPEKMTVSMVQDLMQLMFNEKNCDRARRKSTTRNAESSSLDGFTTSYFINLNDSPIG